MTKRRDAWTAFVDGRPTPGASRPSKYGNHAIVVDGIRFDSKKEAARYQDLKFALKAGKIANLVIHPIYPIVVIGIRADATVIGKYTGDFEYVDLGLFAVGEIVTEDVKSDGTKTKEAYRLRKRAVEAIYGIRIREV